MRTCLESSDADLRTKMADLCKNADPAVAKQIDELEKVIRIAALIDKLNNPDSPVRLDAAYTLAEMGPSAKPAIAALAARLRKETESNVLAQLARTLGQFGALPKDAVDALQEKTTHSNAAARLQVIKALLNLGPEAVLASALFRFVGDDDQDIRKTRR